jgi:photosystem II stability/assembly factor-like uncharacterized protein
MPTRILIGTAKGLLVARSQDHRTWQLDGPYLAGWEVSTTLALPGRMLVGTTHYAYGATIRTSDDDGQTWTQPVSQPRYAEGSPYKVNRIWELVAAPQGGRIYTGVDEAALFASDDRGESWQEITGLTAHPSRPHWYAGGGGLCLHTILVHPRDPQTIWVGISAVGLFRTRDGGRSWTNLNKTLPGLPTGSPDETTICCVHRVALDPTNADTMYMQYHGGVFKSADSGDTWTPIETGLPGNFGFPMVATPAGRLVTVPLESEGTRYVKEGRLRVYASDDRGASWSPSEAGLPADPRYVGVLRSAMAADTQSELIAFGTTLGEVYVSPDAGRSWSQIPGQFQRVLHVSIANV